MAEKIQNCIAQIRNTIASHSQLALISSIVIVGSLLLFFIQYFGSTLQTEPALAEPEPTTYIAQVQPTNSPKGSATSTTKPTATPKPSTAIPKATTVTKTPAPTTKPTAVAQATAKPTTQPSSTTTGVKQYTVQRGDSLWSIAQKELGNGYAWVDIAKINNITNVNTIYSEMKLTIPSNQVAQKLNIGGAQTSQVASVSTYTVQHGDTLWSIAQKVYGDPFQWTVIAKANNLSHPSVIHAGNVLTITQTGTSPPKP